MRRIKLDRRPDFAARCADIGFEYAGAEGEEYWNERACYVFTLAEVENDLEAPTQELAALCKEVAGRVIGDEMALRRLEIPEHAYDAISLSWQRADPSLYGRIDLSYDGKGPAKLLEYNADTPTSLFEAAVVQWEWMRDMVKNGAFPSDTDQFNSLHERLIERWKTVSDGKRLHLACMTDSVEDKGTTDYLADCAIQAGLETSVIGMADIGLRGSDFIDRSGRHIETLFKLYAWEWMFADDFGASPAVANTRFVEPPWKAVLSNKGFLALLWEAEPGHPNLLPTFFETDPRTASLGGRYARKPLLSREGANISLHDGETVLESTDGLYGDGAHIRQALSLLPDFDGNRPVIGSWLVGDDACGMGIRESSGAITTDRAQFTPHVILD